MLLVTVLPVATRVAVMVGRGGGGGGQQPSWQAECTAAFHETVAPFPLRPFPVTVHACGRWHRHSSQRRLSQHI
jgi:hypothetical protein